MNSLDHVNLTEYLDATEAAYWQDISMRLEAAAKQYGYSIEDLAEFAGFASGRNFKRAIKRHSLTFEQVRRLRVHLNLQTDGTCTE